MLPRRRAVISSMETALNHTHTSHLLRAFAAVLAMQCGWVLAEATPQGNDEAVARLMQHWQARILAERMPVEDAANWSRRNLAKFSRFSAEQMRIAQRASTLAEIELLLIDHPIPDGTRLGLAMASQPGMITMIGEARPVTKSSPATAPGAYADLAFTALTPCRLYDSRPSQGGSGIWANASINTINIGPYLSYAFQGGSATDCGMSTLVGSGKIAAIMASVATTSQAGAGYLTFFAHGAPNPFPTTITQSFQAGSVQTSFVIIPTDMVGSVASDAYTTSQTHVIIDVLGYFAQPKAAALDCVTTGASSVIIAAGSSAQPALPACSPGYANVSTRCAADSPWAVLVSNNGTCTYQNDDTSPHTVSAYATCCRTAGR
jgi:hypothetical protein